MTGYADTRNDSSIWLATGAFLAVGLGLLPGPAKLLSLVPVLAGGGVMMLKRPAIALLPAILFCPFNFESLITRIGIPFVNPFNLAWLTAAVALVFLSRQQHRFIWPRSPIDSFLVFNITVTTVSVLRAWHIVPADAFFHHVLVYQQWLQWVLFFWVTSALVRSKGDGRVIVSAVAFMVLVAALFGIKDYISTRAVSGGAIERSQGLFGQANYAGSFFAYYLPPLIALARIRQGKMMRLLLLLAAAAGIVACVLTFSRGSMMALAVAGGLVIVQTRSRTLLLASCVALALIAADPTVRARFAETTQDTGNESVELDDSSGARLIAWRKAMALAQENPLLGHGFYTFRHIHHALDSEAEAKFGHGSMDVHNGHLNILVSAGLFGSAALYLQFGGIIFWCQRLRFTSRDPYIQALAIGLSATVVAIMVINLSGTRMYDRQLMAYLWVLLGALGGMSRYDNETAPEEASSSVSH